MAGGHRHRCECRSEGRLGRGIRPGDFGVAHREFPNPVPKGTAFVALDRGRPARLACGILGFGLAGHAEGGEIDRAGSIAPRVKLGFFQHDRLDRRSPVEDIDLIDSDS